MIRRLVRMKFSEESIHLFRTLFEETKSHILAFEGCIELDLMADADEPLCLCTWSTWMNVDALEKYRQSDLFRSTWSKTKPLFTEKASAWTFEIITPSSHRII